MPNLPRLAICAVVAAAFFVLPPPTGLEVHGWRTLGVFAATILSFLLRPMAMGPMVLLAVMGLSATKTLKYKELMAGFGDSTVWLVVAAFLIAGAVSRTGFGRRVALTLVTKLGRTTVGLGYATCGAELILGPVVPSNTARGGGVMAPVVQSLCAALDSHPDRGPERAGSYLALVGAHANLITAAMFLTGMAANPLVSKAAMDVWGVDFGWGTWALGAIVPGLLGLGLLPLFMLWLAKPTVRDASSAQAKAVEELQAMGPWSRNQKVMGGVFLGLLLLWASAKLHGMGSGLVAWLGVLALLLSGTEKWSDITGNSKAWDTLVWLGGLLAMANGLKDAGVVDWFAGNMRELLLGMDSAALLAAIGIIYFYSMYGFSMLTAHITAFVAAFMAVAMGAGAPAMVCIAVLAYASNLSGCLTNYSSGPIIIYFGLGYVRTPQWFRVGALVSVFHLVIWGGVGSIWWAILGWW